LLIWAGVIFVSIVFVELARLNWMLATSLAREIKLQEAPGRTLRGDPPLVSVVVPARDEADNIETSVRALLRSDYPRLEVVVVDDRSEDDTFGIVSRLAAEDPRITVSRVEELPAGWTGKTHAMYLAARRAAGEILLFTDADTELGRCTVSLALDFLEENDLDMLSMLPQFTKRGFSENAVYPHLALGFSYFYPLIEVNDPSKPAALASGCFIMIKRTTYDNLGTWSRFKTEISEDVALSKAVKAEGARLTVVRGGDLVRTKPFAGVADVCRFWKRTFYGGLEKSVLRVTRLLGNYIFLSLLFVLFFWSGASVLSGHLSVPLVLLFSISTLAAAGVIVPLGLVVKQEQGEWWYALTAPLGLLISAWVALGALLAIAKGTGIRWRGSQYK
jgi:chlorobactene glucosyltransferase